MNVSGLEINHKMSLPLIKTTLESPAYSIDQAVFCQLSRSQDDDGLLGHLLLLQLLRLQLLLLGIVVGEVVDHDGDRQGHYKYATNCREGANLWWMMKRGLG